MLQCTLIGVIKVDNSRDNNRLYKIVALALGISVAVLFLLVIILFVKMDNNSRLLSRIETSFLNSNLYIKTEGDAVPSNVNSFGQDVDLSLNEAQMIIDGNENLSYAIDEEKDLESGRVVYLTFDDGPSSNTAQILKILKEYNVKATFFVNGKQSEELRNLITQIYEDGHTVGMHSYSHKYDEVYASKEKFLEDMNQIEHLIYAQTGVHPTLYRFPGGSSNSVSRGKIGEYIKALEDEHIRYVDWNISSGDATGRTALSAKTITENVLDGYRNSEYHTNVVLLHDTDLRDTTVEALPDIIKELRNEGATLSEITDNTKDVHHVEK